METKKKKKTMTQEQVNESLINNFHLTMGDALKGVQQEMQRLYPKSVLYYIACEDANQAQKSINGVKGGYGSDQDIVDLMIGLIEYDSQFRSFIDSAYLRHIMYMDTTGMRDLNEFRNLQEAHLRYAESQGIDCSTFRESNGIPKKYLHRMGQTVKPSDREAHITELEEELNRLKDQRNPRNQELLLKAEIKRLNRAGNMEKAKQKQEELNEILEQARLYEEGVRKAKEKEESKRQLAERRRGFLLKGRAVLAENRAEAKRKKEQAEIDRQKAQQFNPHRAAKAKMKKIRERQAERNASKKKASENKEWANRPISQVIASRVG